MNHLVGGPDPGKRFAPVDFAHEARVDSAIPGEPFEAPAFWSVADDDESAGPCAQIIAMAMISRHVLDHPVHTLARHQAPHADRHPLRPELAASRGNRGGDVRHLDRRREHVRDALDRRTCLGVEHGQQLEVGHVGRERPARRSVGHRAHDRARHAPRQRGEEPDVRSMGDDLEARFSRFDSGPTDRGRRCGAPSPTHDRRCRDWPCARNAPMGDHSVDAQAS